MTDRPITRLAPSPTGALHLGNALTFLSTWALARQAGWTILLRIEDLDTPPVKAGADRQVIEDLAWLGIDWDEGPVYQRADLKPYQAALDRLHRAGHVYPCACTRRDLESAASAPHAGDHEVRYPGTCRPAPGAPAPPPPVLDGRPQPAAWRLRAPDGSRAVRDLRLGERTFDIQREAGDFVVATKAGLPAYQLAVVVDDARQGVTDVVRGEDLLASAARQDLLYELLGLGPPPRYQHLPLVVGPDGLRLAKRHGDTRIAAYREAGVPAGRVIGLLAHWCGMNEVRAPMAAGEFLKRFDADRLPRGPVVLAAGDEAWLRGGKSVG